MDVRAHPTNLPVDPTLPWLPLALDTVAMGRVFDGLLRAEGQPHRVLSCRLDRVKYRPRRNATLSYRLLLAHAESGERFEQRVAARVCAAGDAPRRAAKAAAQPSAPSAAGPALRVLPALDMLTWWWPNDARLLAPHWLADTAALHGEVVPELLAALVGPRPDGSAGCLLQQATVTIVQYVPEHRLTARVQLKWLLDGQAYCRTVYAKASNEPDGATAHALLQALQQSDAVRQGRLRTPAALLWQPRAGLHWQQAMPGTPWADLADGAHHPAASKWHPMANSRIGRLTAQLNAQLSADLGAQLAALHATPLPLLQTPDPATLHSRLLARLAEASASLGHVLQSDQALLAQAAADLAVGLPHALAGALPSTLHGDLHTRNILVDTANGNCLALIDLDSLRRGPAVLELGAWVADSLYRALLDGDEPWRDAAACQALLGAYVRAGGQPVAAGALAWATAWSLLTQRAWRCVVNLKPGRLALVPQLLAHAAALASGRTTLPWTDSP